MVTELRVHGVTGTPAESMLDRPLLRRVAGDAEAGFYRPRVEHGGATGPGGVTLEAYRWGNLTAGAAARALWLMLLPFMLANVAIWLRPKSGKLATTLVRGVGRIFALSVTATFILALVGISLDLVAWQCAAFEACTRDRFYLAPFADGFFASTGRRLALASLVPLLGFAFLWFLGRRTWSRYEAYPSTENGDGDGLSHPCFWNGRPLVGRLRAIHVSFAFATLDAVLLGVLVPHDRATAGVWRDIRLAPVGYALAAATALVLLLCCVAVCLRAVMHRDAPARFARPLVKLLRAVAIALFLATIGYAIVPRSEWETAGGLPYFATTLTTLFAAQTVLLGVLGLVIMSVRPRKAFLGGLASPILASLGLGVAVAFSAGMAFRVADFLDRDGLPSAADYTSEASAGALQPPTSYEWAAIGFVAFLLMLIVVWLAVRVTLMRRLLRYGRVVTDADFRGRRADDPRRAAEIDDAVADALVTDHAGKLIGWAYTPLAVAAVAVTGLAIAGVRPLELAPSNSPAAFALSYGVRAGTYLIGLAALALLVVGLLAYRYQRFRRIVGVLWDLGTFWPRSGHPLAPPCYAERVIPELATRSAYLAGSGGLVLSGHSQGSVLVAATLLQLPPRLQARTALLTYGSPLRRLYARLFPAYVDDELLARVGGALTYPDQPTRWVNLWRDTDPIGGPVNAPAHDVRLVDPHGYGFPPGDSVFPEIAGHSNYQLYPAYADAVSLVASSLAAASPAAAPAGQPGGQPAHWVPPATSAAMDPGSSAPPPAVPAPTPAPDPSAQT